MEAYLNARLICDPIGLFDCVPRVCGAEGFLVMTEDRARSLGLPYVLIAGAVERHNAFADDPVISHFGVAGESDNLFRQAGVGPDAIRFVEAYDDYPVMVMLELEALGFSRPGETVSMVREKTLTLDGDLPVNTSGGMLSLGQAGAGAGFLHINEAIGQLTGRPMGRPVDNAGIRARELSRHRQLRPGPLHRRDHFPERRDRMKRRPDLPPRVRGRVARRLTAAAARGAFELPVCQDCATIVYPPQEVCRKCLSDRLRWQDISPLGKLLAFGTVHHSTDAYFTRRRPLIMGTVQLDAGPDRHLARGCGLRKDQRTRAALQLSRSWRRTGVRRHAGERHHGIDRHQRSQPRGEGQGRSRSPAPMAGSARRWSTAFLKAGAPA